MRSLKALLALIAVPLFFFNMLGGIVGAVWLGVLGDWKLLGVGFAAMIGAGFGLSLALIPGLAFLAPAALARKADSPLLLISLSLSSLYTLTVISAWCLAVFYYSIGLSKAGKIVPIMLWAYAVASAPVSWLSSKEAQSGEGGFASMLTTLFTQIACATVAILFAFVTRYFEIGVYVFAAIMAVCLVLLVVFAAFMTSQAGTYT